MRRSHFTLQLCAKLNVWLKCDEMRGEKYDGVLEPLLTKENKKLD